MKPKYKKGSTKEAPPWNGQWKNTGGFLRPIMLRKPLPPVSLDISFWRQLYIHDETQTCFYQCQMIRTWLSIAQCISGRHIKYNDTLKRHNKSDYEIQHQLFKKAFSSWYSTAWSFFSHLKTFHHFTIVLLNYNKHTPKSNTEPHILKDTVIPILKNTDWIFLHNFTRWMIGICLVLVHDRIKIWAWPGLAI